MKKNKIILAAIVLAGVFVIGGVVAYFTDTDSKTNTFTVGNVEIEVLEPGWDALPKGEGDANIPDDAENMMPGDKVTKDPKIHNKSTTNPAYVFMKVESPCTTGSTPLELFDYTTTPGVNSGWELMTNGTCTSGKITRIYSYSTSGTMTALAANGNTPTLFDTLTLNKNVTGDIPSNTDVKITGYAVQTTGLEGNPTTPSTVWSAANFS